jgi:putative tryptophan/tyrosine transport system substrate-binding protein
MSILAWKSFVSRALLAASLLPAAAALPEADNRPERLILYINEDNERVRQAIGKLQAYFREMGIAARHRIRLQHIVVNVSSLTSADTVKIRESLAAHPAVIIAPNGESAERAKAATASVPILFASYQDPIALGLIKSFARPGENITGFTLFVPIDQKRLELLLQLSPKAKRVGILVDRYGRRDAGLTDFLDRPQAVHGFQTEMFVAETVADLEGVLSTPRAKRIDAWYVPYTVLPFEEPDAVVRLFNSVRKPVIFSHTHFVERGGLLSYQPAMTIDEGLRLWATMVGLILDGVAPGEIPIERPKSFELAVNVDTARRIGVAIPVSFLKRADRVITGTPMKPVASR